MGSYSKKKSCLLQLKISKAALSISNNVLIPSFPTVHPPPCEGRAYCFSVLKIKLKTDNF